MSDRITTRDVVPSKENIERLVKEQEQIVELLREERVKAEAAEGSAKLHLKKMEENHANLRRALSSALDYLVILRERKKEWS